MRRVERTTHQTKSIYKNGGRIVQTILKSECGPAEKTPLSSTVVEEGCIKEFYNNGG